jgi:preprotein translocase subunit SecY
VLSAFVHAFRTPDLRRKIFFTLGVLAVFRLGSVVPAPGVSATAVRQCLESAAVQENALYGLINLFSGGALLQLAVLALGIMPYITASIIIQLLTVVIPRLEALKKEGQAGQPKITQYTRYLTIGSRDPAVDDDHLPGPPARPPDPGLRPAAAARHLDPAIVTMVITMTAGTAVVMWLGELITDPRRRQRACRC